MAIITGDQFRLFEDNTGRNISEGLALGQRIRAIQDLRGAQGRSSQIRDLLANSGKTQPQTQQNQFLQEQTQQFGEDPAVGKDTVFSQEELIQAAKRIDPEEAFRQLKIMGFDEPARLAEASRFVTTLQTTPLSQRQDRILARAQSLKEQGRDPKDTLQLLDMSEAEQEQALTGIQLLDLSTKDRLATTRTGQRKQLIKAGSDDKGRGFFDLSSGSAERIPGAIPEKKAPLVEIGVGKEKEEIAKIRAKGFSVVQKKAIQAEENLQSLDVLDAIEVRTGRGEPAKQAIAAWGQSFGLDTSKLANVAAGEAFTAEAGRVVLRVLASQKGPQTDNDRKEIAKTLARLGTTPEANTFISTVARATANRAIEQRDFMENWLNKNDSLRGANIAWAKKKRNVPMVSKFVKDSSGLPVFFFQFEEAVQKANPDASKADIIDAWESQEDAAQAKK